MIKEKISKIVSVLKKDGFAVAFRKIIKYAKGTVKKHLKIGYKTDFIKNKNYYGIMIDNALLGSFDRILVWRGSFGWSVPLFQRPQHIANAMSELSCLVFYEVTQMTDSTKAIEKKKDNLYLVNFENSYISSMLLSKLEETDKPKYLQFYSTDWTLNLSCVKEFQNRGYGILYEYIDEINPHLAGTSSLPLNISEKYNYAMNSPDDVLIVVTADMLQKDVLKKRGEKNTVFAANGVDYDFFRNIKTDFEFPAEFLEILNSGKTLVGYYGAMANWIDYELIKKVCDTDEYIFVLFGVRYDTSLDDSGILNHKNVKFMGSVDYKELKYYASKLDILTIPFIINSITRATSPLKLFEYMALHKPIVTSDMNECKKFKSPLIAADSDEFLRLLDKAKGLIASEEYINLCDNEAKANCWNFKAKEIISLMEKYEESRKI